MAKPRYTNAQEMHLWKRQIQQQDQRHRDYAKDAERAEIAIEKAEENAESILERAQTEAQRAASERSKLWAGEEKKLLTRPRLIRRGGTFAIADDIWVTHVRATIPTPLAKQIGLPESATPLVRLRPGGGMDASDLAPVVVASEAPQVTNSEYFEAWATDLTPLSNDLQTRYQILGKLRDDTWFAGLLESAGVTTETKRQEEIPGTYDRYTRDVRSIEVPRLTSVRIERTGLVLTFGHQPGTSAKDWKARIDTLRSAFSNAGMYAGNLQVHDGSAGEVVMRFNDVDPFSGVTPDSGHFDTEKMRSLLGVTSEGEEAWVTWSGSSGMVIGGVPGSGKTASFLPLFAGMAGKAALFVFDGKSGFDLHPLRHIAQVYDRSGDLDAPLDTLRRLEALRAQRAEAMYASAGANNFWNIPEKTRERLQLTPVFVVLDECQTWLDQSGMEKEEKRTSDEIRRLVRTLIQKGRSAGVIVVLTTQKPDAVSVPTVIRDNASLKVCFRVSTPEQAITVLGRQAPGAPDPTEILMSARGRGVMETEGRGIALFQAGYTDSAVLEEELQHAGSAPDPFEVVANLMGTEALEPASDEDAEIPELTREQVLEQAIRLGLIPVPDSDPEPVKPVRRPPTKRAPRTTKTTTTTRAPKPTSFDGGLPL